MIVNFDMLFPKDAIWFKDIILVALVSTIYKNNDVLSKGGLLIEVIDETAFILIIFFSFYLLQFFVTSLLEGNPSIALTNSIRTLLTDNFTADFPKLVSKTSD